MNGMEPADFLRVHQEVRAVKREKEKAPEIAVPEFVGTLIKRLQSKGYEAYVVGGAVRDRCMNHPVSDWDVATSAPPRRIRSIFRDIRSFFLKHETVTLVEKGSHYEVSSFRSGKGPGKAIQEDLAHRDFTVNAMAYDATGRKIIDPFGGRRDIYRKLVKAVGKPGDRFREDPLRLIRAVRISTELGFKIEPRTSKAIARRRHLLAGVARERIRDELVKILATGKPSRGLDLLRRFGLLQEFLPELLEGYRKKQNSYHQHTIYRHIMEAVDQVEPDPVMRLTALFHDIAKPRHREKVKGEFHFPGHESASAAMASEIMMRLKFSKGTIHEVSHLIRHHLPMTSYDATWSAETLRRLISRVGPENIDRFFSFSRADMLSHGMKDHRPDALSRLHRRARNMIRKPLPLETAHLAIRGKKVMEMFGLRPGPKVGKILDYLVDRVTAHPEMNKEEKLVALLEEMNVEKRKI
jgi:poly(A) polymerase/tRNA nucleotidyltransferase (CCA-adding enzyme)